MKKRIFLFIALLLLGSRLQAQYISLDTSGRVNEIQLTSHTTPIVKVAGTLSGTFLQEKLKSFFRKKIDASVKHLKDPNLVYLKYYDPAIVSALVKELTAIRSWIDNPAVTPSPKYLKPFFNKLSILLNSKTADWYQLNGLPFSNTLQLADNNFDPVAKAYVIDLTINRLFNKFLVDLYNDTYQKSDNKINGLTTITYLKAEKDLKDLYQKTLTLSTSVNDLTQEQFEDINTVNSTLNTNAIINAIMNASYFKNWIWLRGGEPVINPFEILAKDTLTGKPVTPLTREDNVSLVEQTNIPSELLNRILLSENGVNRERNIHFFRLPDDPTNKQTGEIDNPLRGDENVRVNMHNTLANENPKLRIVKQDPHSGRSGLIDSISSGLGILATAYALFTPYASFINPIFSQGSQEKTTKDDIAAKASTIDKNITDTVTIQKLLEAAITNSNHFNKSVFEQTKKTVTVKQANGSILSTSTYINNFIEAYTTLYDQYALRLEILSQDSLILAVTLPIVAASNLPPDTMVLNNTGITTPVYRTVVLETGKVDKDVTTEYAVRDFFMKDDVKDSSTLATFTVKTANLKRMMASAGVMFTGALANYGQTTFTPGTATTGASIKTSAKTTSFVVGLNIYFVRINMLDEHWFHSKDCPYYTRFSLFLGLDVPDIKDHFYPGISYDLVPGIKLTGGTHLYRHTKYSIANNEAKKTANVLSLAGPFIGLNIDTEAIIKVINIFK